MDYPQVAWSDDVRMSEWLTGRMTSLSVFTASDVVPSGFAAYARVPREDQNGEGRWRGALPVADATARFGRHLANLWWPDDQMWCVVTQAGLLSTYVGGSEQVISTVIAKMGPMGVGRVSLAEGLPEVET